MKRLIVLLVVFAATTLGSAPNLQGVEQKNTFVLSVDNLTKEADSLSKQLKSYEKIGD